MKRVVAVLSALLLVCMLGINALAEGANLLKNGGFEDNDGAGTPENWYATAYRSQAGYSRLSVTRDKAHSGAFSAVIENASSNDARYTCTVKVEEETLYRLSGYVLVENMEDTGNGANFGIEGIYSFSEGLFDTEGHWQYLEWYGETGENQREVTIGIRVGGYSAESIGKAYFDDIVLEKVDALPSGVIASLWYNPSTDNSVSEGADGLPGKNTYLFIGVGFVFALLAVLLSSKMEKTISSAYANVVFVILMAAALFLRVILAVCVEGYAVDINCFKAWSLRMAQVGPAGFYAPDYFCDYPPGAMLLLWPIGILLNAVGLEHNGVSLLVVKLLPIVCDLAGAYCIYRCAQKRWKHFASIAMSALYLFNPAVLVNGAAWGQMDSVLALLLLLTAFAAMDKKWSVAIPAFAVSALVKPQALLFAPVGGAALLVHLFSSKDADRQNVIKHMVYGVLAAIGCIVLIAFPFAVGQENPVAWLLSLYGATLGSYAYATLNTANLHYLADANWLPLSSQPSVWLFILPMALLAALCCMMLFKRTQRFFGGHLLKRKWIAGLSGGMTACLAILFVLGADYSWYGYAMMAFAYLFALICLFCDRNFESLPYWMALALIGVYVIGIKVHERYLFPALLLVLVCCVYTRDKRLLAVLAGFSVTTFINTAIVLENSILFGAAQGHLNSDTIVLNKLLCVGNIGLFLYSCWIGFTGLRESVFNPRKKKAPSSEQRFVSSYEMKLFMPSDHRLHLRVRDYLLLGITTAAYAVLAFSNLGSPVAPQTAWVATADDESVVLELEDASTFSVLYYAGVSYRDFAIAVSDDGVNWSENYSCEMREGLCYRWNYVLKTDSSAEKVSYPSSNPANVLWLNGKYLRIDACSAGLNLWEIVARDEKGNNLPLKLVRHTNARAEFLDESKPASNLIDEQDTCSGEPGWYNGTYFDEIYHARTAYEHLHGQAPYETTHPPLGKLMMSAGIAAFGMTPFGWRFAGALIGVLMLPAIYLLAMQLTHKRGVALVSMLALTFDLMHFTQTRIATIDSFPVFFILLTYLFMVRFMQMDSFAVSDPQHPKLLDKAYVKTLVPLLMCGICMGLSISSKWIGIYSALGLALLFFLTMYRHIRTWNTAWNVEDASSVRIVAAREFTIQRIAITCGFCVIFFVLIPCLIYAASYIPYLAPTGPVTLKRIISAQKGMLSYHSTPGLGMDHPFQSPWWQWPFIMKPMWFAQDTFEPAGYASTIMCMGNPWVFYIGAVAMAAVLGLCVCRYVSLQNGRLEWKPGDGNLTLVILAIAFLAQYLPWVLVPRSMYMYHYFASVPFIIIATAILLDKLFAKNRGAYNFACVVYIAGTVVFFVMFFPYASGYLTSIRWLDAMKWFSKLYY